MNIYIGNFSYDVTGDDLQEVFGTFGHVESAKVIRNKMTGDSKGFGFVEMPNKTEAQAAMQVTGLSYDLKFQKTSYDNDVIIQQDEVRIFLNSESISFLTGIEIDYVDTLKESGFQYKNPNANSSCGCGTSFN